MLLLVEVLELDLHVAGQVGAEGEVGVLRIIAGGEAGAVAGGVIAGGHDVPAGAEAPVGAAPGERLPADPAAAVALVGQAAAFVRLEAVGMAGRGRGLDVEKGEARA